MIYEKQTTNTLLGTNGLQTLRDFLNCSPSVFAHLLGVRPVSLTRWERNQDYPSDQMIRKLAGRLNLTTREFRDILITDHADYEPPAHLIERLNFFRERIHKTP
jgi:transcriptional regulator with XRE-family HTH domain